MGLNGFAGKKLHPGIGSNSDAALATTMEGPVGAGSLCKKNPISPSGLVSHPCNSRPVTKAPAGKRTHACIRPLDVFNSACSESTNPVLDVAPLPTSNSDAPITWTLSVVPNVRGVGDV